MLPSNLNEHWQRLTAAATLGTARQALKANDAWPDFLADLNGEASETAVTATHLLRAAAATHLLRLAAQRSTAMDATKPKPDGVEPQPFCSENASWRLARLLTGDMRFLVREWCELAARANKVLAPHWLPTALLAADKEELRFLQPVLGIRAQWLARQKTSSPVDNTSIEPNGDWQHGTLAEREALLIRLRSNQPASARALVEETWATDSPDARVAFLTALLNGLSTDDEPLLERALDDKRKNVRTAALSCLVRLGRSAHQKRMIDRVAPLIAFDANAKGGLLGMKRLPQLSITLPQTPASDAVRDGIDLKPPAQRKIGERSFWLLQMLSTIDPAYWSSKYGVQPAVWLTAISRADEAELLIEATAAATIAHSNNEWSQALCAWWAEEPNEKLRAIVPLPPLLSVLAPNERNEAAVQLLDKLGRRSTELAFPLLAAVDGNWSPKLSRAALETILAAIKSNAHQWAYARDVLQGFAMHVDTALATGMLDALQNACVDPSPWLVTIKRFADIVEFRNAMRSELQ